MSATLQARPGVGAAPGLPVRFARAGRRFGQITALADVSLELRGGESLLLLGANGAGKSTLLRIAAGLVRPTTGEVRIGEQPAWTPADVRCRAVLGYVGHRSLLYDHLTAQENLVLYGRLYGLEGAEASRRAAVWLERVGLSRAAHRPMRGFSRGMQQRLALARGLIHEPRVLLLDEPASGLDGEGRARLNELIAERRRAGVTLMYVSHHAEAALPLADRVVILHRGRVVDDDRAAARGAAEWVQRAAAHARGEA